MKKFNFKRMLLLAVMLMTLTSVIALTAFAEITGGNGAFVGSDYVNDTFATYTMNGLTMVEGTYETLTETNNTGLAGLYMVKENGGAGKIVYVRGTVAARQTITSTISTTDLINNYTGNAWKIPGKMSNTGYNGAITKNTGYTSFGPDSHYAIVSSAYNKVAFVMTSSPNYLDAAYQIKKGVITAADYANACALFSFKYSLNQDEIIPATEFNSFTYGVARTATIETGATDTKLLVLVYDAVNKEFKTFEAIDDVKTADKKTDTTVKATVTSVHTVNASDLVLTGGTQKLSDLGAGNYILGYEVFPAVNIDSTKLTYDASTQEESYTGSRSGIVNSFFLTIYYDSYDIAPVAAPSFTYDADTKTVSGLDANTTNKYYIAKLKMSLAGDTMVLDSTTKANLATDANGKATLNTLAAGLWGIGVNGDTYTADSAFKAVYIQGKYSEKQELGDVNSEGVPAFAGSDTTWQTGLWSGRVNYIENKTLGSSYILSNNTAQLSCFSTGNTSAQYFLKNGTDAQKAEARNNIASEVNALSHKYAYMGEEIIPAKNFERFTYRVGFRQGSTSLAAADSNKNRNTKLVIYVADEYGNITKYEKLSTVSDMAIGINNGNSTKIAVEAADLKNGANSISTSDGYVVGVEVYPVQITDVSEITARDASTLYNTSFRVYIHYAANDYTFSVDRASAPTGLEYDLEANKLSGLSSSKTYYITTYDVTGADYENGVAITPEADGTYTVPATYKGLTAIFFKGNDYEADSAPFLFWTKSDRAGKFTLDSQKFTRGTAVSGVDLIVPGKFTTPNVPSVSGNDIVNGHGMGFDLIGFTYTKTTIGSTTVNVPANNYEDKIEYAGIYYGFTSDEAFPIDQFEGLSLIDSAAIQGGTIAANISYDGTTITSVTGATNGNTYQGDLVLYYVDKNGTLGTYTIKGTLQSSTSFSNHKYVPTAGDVIALDALSECYVVGYALLPYATINTATGAQNRLFSHYTATGGNVYIPISNDPSHTKGFNLTLPDLPDTIVGGNGKIEGLDSNVSYKISPVTMKGANMSGYNLVNNITQIAAEVSADEWADLTENSGLVGLYKIKAVDSNGDLTNAKHVYVNGKAADKTALSSTTTHMVNNYSGPSWALGRFSKDASVTLTVSGTVVNLGGHQHVFTVSTANKNYSQFKFCNTSSTPADYIKTQEAGGDTTGAARKLVAEATEYYTIKYAMEAKEVIPASDFNSITYTSGYQGAVFMGQAKTKLRFYVYDAATQSLKIYDAYDEVPTSSTNGVRTTHTISADEAKLVTTDADLDRSIVYDSTKTLANIGDGSYIVGLEFHPVAYLDTSATAMNEWTLKDATASTATFSLDRALYDIDVPKATKPTFTFDEATKVVSGLDASTTNKYYIVKLVNNGTGTLVPDATTKVALPTDAEGKADLGTLGYKSGDFGIGAYGSDYILDSDYTLVSIAAPDAPTFTYDSLAKKISGLEANTTNKYYAVQLGMNSIATMMQTVGTKANLATDAEGKADLSAFAAGLWGVGLNETSSSAASNYTVVYVSGTYNQKQALGDIDSTTGKPATSGADDWQTGVWTGKLGHNLQQTIGKSYQLTNGGAHFSSVAMGAVGGGSVQDKLYQGTPTEKTAAQNTITADMNGLSFKYAYMGEEIIPAADFESFTYKVGIRQGNTRLAAEDSNDNTNTKVVVYVANADNTLTKYVKLINEPSMTIRALNGLSNEIVVTAADLMNGSEAISTSAGYIVGIEVFPVQITDPTELYAVETTYKPNGVPTYVNFSFNFEVLYSKYTFDVPQATINSGITYNAFDNAITGLTDTTKEYYLATYTLDGTNTDLNGDGTYYDLKLEGIVDGKWALTEDAPTGLVAVIAKGDDYTKDSEPVIFYTPSKNAGHFNSVAGTQIPGVDTKAAGYYGTVGKLTYEATAPIYTGTPAASGLGGIKPSIYSSVTELAYQLIERKYNNTGIKVNDGTTNYTLYEEGALNGNMEDIAFFYGFESDEIFHIQDFKGLNISGATFLQGAASKNAVACDAGDTGAILDATSGRYFRVLSGYVNEGASFKSMLTLYYLDLSDGTMKSVDFYTGAIAGTAASVNFAPTSDISSLNGYVLGFSLKPYQQIEKNGHETIFSHTLNFGGQCYWTIGEAAGNVAVASRTNSLNVGEHIYAGEVPQDMGGFNGRFVASAANADAYASKYFQAAPLEISADGLSLVAGAYGDVFQLNNTNINNNFQGLWMVRFCNAAGTAGGAPSDVVYFSGTNETRLQLGNLSADGKPAISSANTWKKGVWSGSITYIDGASLGNNYKLSNSGSQLPSMTMSALGSGSVQDMLYQGDVTQKAAAQTTVMNEINALSHKYAYMDEEIIPAKDFVSFTYRVGKRQGNICFASGTSTANTNTKLVVYVANSDKTITKYEKLVNEPTMKIYDDNGLSSKIVVKAADLLNGTEKLNESDGYVIGIEIFPIQITDKTEISAKEPTYGSTDPKQFLHGSLNVDVVYGDYALRVIPETPKFNVENALPADKVEGETYAYATITGLIPSYRYEMLVDAAADTWVDLPYFSNGTYNPGSTGMELHKSEYSIKVPVNTDGTKTETYVIRVKDSELTTASPSVEVKVYYLDGDEYQFSSLENEEQIINFATDFVEVQADYTIDVVNKPWTQNIALNNLKLAAPKALITFEGDGFKFVVRAEDINIDRTVHYYSFNVGINGASRKDFFFDEMKALAGDKFVAEYMLDSLYELPFTKADLHIYVGEKYNGKTLELRSYYEEIGRLRKWADADVDDGWIVFNLYDQAYVIYDNN